MAVTFHPDYSPMIRKLESIFTLTDDERHALQKLSIQRVAIRPDQDIVREGDQPSRSCLILSGFACTYKVTAQGKRQIVSFNLPGDIPDLQSLHLKVIDNSIGTISPCTVGFITHDDLRDLCERYPRITAALWRHLPGVGDERRTPRSLHAHGPRLLRVADALAGGWPCGGPCL
ncbi:Crp/Fnr family transcriptional regulator [Microvirga tunisiensis]|uniref:Crp/Fnr family transcriptional regulator n=1 Tax=Microvirga tunisiensis TaxID=2108360 RepID=UPI0030B883B6